MAPPKFRGYGLTGDGTICTNKSGIACASCAFMSSWRMGAGRKALPARALASHNPAARAHRRCNAVGYDVPELGVKPERLGLKDRNLLI